MKNNNKKNPNELDNEIEKKVEDVAQQLDTENTDNCKETDSNVVKPAANVEQDNQNNVNTSTQEVATEGDIQETQLDNVEIINQIIDAQNNFIEQIESKNINLTPDIIKLIAISDRPFFPTQRLPVVIEKKTWSRTFNNIKISDDEIIGVLYTPNGKNKTANDIVNRVGTLIKISNFVINNNSVRFTAEGIHRFTIKKFITQKAPYSVEVAYDFDETQPVTDKIRAYALATENAMKKILTMTPMLNQDLKSIINHFSSDNVVEMADFAINIVNIETKKLQAILETKSLTKRMKKMMDAILKELELTKMQQDIRDRVEEKFLHQQRDVFLKQQLKEIQLELGITKDEKSYEFEYYYQKLKRFALDSSQLEKVYNELKKLVKLDQHSAEYSITKSWMDLIVSLPWNKQSKDKFDITRTRKILNKSHYGLDDVKTRILEFIAVANLKGEISGSVILLVGPPGVGKTSIGITIAEAIGRKFFRFPVGGMRDEAEIKGHRRTYIGAMPGKLIQAVKETKKNNPVIMLDEIDKIGTSYHGDPASALLEVLDQTQNKSFLDHYLDIKFDLSKVLFICTANSTDSISKVLLDRMEVIRLSGYIMEEKLAIAKKILWKNIVKPLRLPTSKLKISSSAIKFLIESYSREAGVRGLQRNLEKLVRKSAMDFLEKKSETVVIDTAEIEKKLGPPIFVDDNKDNDIGVVTGLAWTEMGGVTMNVESRKIYNKERGFKYSGQLGKVMQESAQLAYSYVNSKSLELFKDSDFFDKSYIHLHVPDGATPKDGPSAGITIVSSLLSLALSKKIKPNVAMTGELSLTGQVLPVGGIKEKIIAAKRTHQKEVILPYANKADFNQLSEDITKGITFHFVKDYNDIIKICF